MNYIEVINDNTNAVKLQVVYLSEGKAYKEETSNINPKKIRRIDIPCNANGITVTIFILLPDGKYKNIFEDSFAKAEQRCYGVRGTLKDPKASKINCSLIPNTDWIDVKNKSRSMIYFEVLYIIGKEGFKEKTSEIKEFRSRGIILPRNAGKVQLKIYMEDKRHHLEPFEVIYTEYLYHPFKICYEVSGIIPYTHCEKVPCPKCNDVPNNKYCCCCCHLYNKR